MSTSARMSMSMSTRMSFLDLLINLCERRSTMLPSAARLFSVPHPLYVPDFHSLLLSWTRDGVVAPPARPWDGLIESSHVAQGGGTPRHHL
jgi:hypothetical protein